MIEPGTTVPLVYQNVAYASDPTLYYVRAVIRDSLSGTILETKNLTHIATGRYTSVFTAPEDGQGTGRHIDITITVYTDSGYTIKSTDYQERNYTLISKSSHVFGGGGSNIDYDLIVKLIKQMLDEKFVKEEKGEEKPIDFSPVLTLSKEAISAIADLKASIKPAEKVELEPVLKAINALNDLPKRIKFDPIFSLVQQAALDVMQKIEEKEVTKVDLTQMVQMLTNIQSHLEKFATNEEARDTFAEMIGSVKEKMTSGQLPRKGAVKSKYFTELE